MAHIVPRILSKNNRAAVYLSKYRKVKVSTHWVDLEIPKQTKKLIESLDLHIT